MLFSITAEYSPQALNAMRENPDTNRREAVEKLISAGGGKLVAMYGRAPHGPGFLIIVDTPDPDMAVASVGVAMSAGALQNVELTRLYTMDEVAGLQKKARQLHSVYKPPGKM